MLRVGLSSRLQWSPLLLYYHLIRRPPLSDNITRGTHTPGRREGGSPEPNEPLDPLLQLSTVKLPYNGLAYNVSLAIKYLFSWPVQEPMVFYRKFVGYNGLGCNVLFTITYLVSGPKPSMDTWYNVLLSAGHLCILKCRHSVAGMPTPATCQPHCHLN